MYCGHSLVEGQHSPILPNVQGRSKVFAAGQARVTLSTM